MAGPEAKIGTGRSRGGGLSSAKNEHNRVAVVGSYIAQ